MSATSWFDFFKIPLISSTVSTALSLSVYPFDLLNTVSKTTTTKRKIRILVKDVYKKFGFKGFYRGGTMVFYELFPMYFVFFATYDYLNRKLADIFDRRNYKKRWMIPMISSWFSELSCMSFYVPFDTVMTRMQSLSSQYKYRSFWHGLESIYKNEGLLRFYSSSHLFITYCLVYTTIQFTSYEWLKAVWNN